MIYDFHNHTFFSDGELLPVELARRVIQRGYGAVAYTDHASLSNYQRLLDEATRDARIVEEYWGIPAIPGIELTHVPAGALAGIATEARQHGAALIVAHGETIWEPVEPGTNRAAVTAPHVDILAHPGLIAEDDAALAAANGVFLEITTRRGHSLTNGHVVQVGRRVGARFLVNSDAHSPGDFLSEELAWQAALGAGLTRSEAREVLEENPRLLLSRLLPRLQALGLGRPLEREG